MRWNACVCSSRIIQPATLFRRVDFLITNFSNEPLRGTNENSENILLNMFIQGISVGQNYYPIGELCAIRIIRQKPTKLL
jgi:hypothetical protein